MTKNTALRISVLGLVLSGMAIPASTQTMSFQQAPKNVRGSFVVDQEVVIQESFDVRHKGTGTPYFTTFSPGQGGTFAPRLASDGAGNSLAYYVYDDVAQRNILKDLSVSPSPAEVLSGSFPDSSKFQTQTRNFAVAIPAGTFPVAGTYTDTLIMTLYPGTVTSHGTSADQSSFSLTIKVPKLMDLSLVAANSFFDLNSVALTMDFGLLSAGSTRSADLVVRSNAPYGVTVTSRNGGIMKINDPADSSTVPYTFDVNGTARTLPAGTAASIASGMAPTGFEGTRFRLSFTIGDFGMATEGTYSDVLTLTVIAN